MKKYQISALRNSPNVNLYRVFNSPLNESIGVYWNRPSIMNERMCSKKTSVRKNYLVPIAVQIFFRPSEYFFDVFFWTVVVSSLCFEISLHEPVNVFL